jgi:hypothetical protein
MGTLIQEKPAKTSERSALSRIFTARARHQRDRDCPSQSRAAAQCDGAADRVVELWSDRSRESGKDL